MALKGKLFLLLVLFEDFGLFTLDRMLVYPSFQLHFQELLRFLLCSAVILSDHSVSSAHIAIPEAVYMLENLLIVFHLLDVSELQYTATVLLNQIPILLHLPQKLANLLERALFAASHLVYETCRRHRRPQLPACQKGSGCWSNGCL